MNSHRDNVKDAIKEVLEKYNIDCDDETDIKYQIADDVFDALGISEDEQDKCGGIFVLRTVKSESQVIPPKTSEYKIGVDMSVEDAENEYTRRTKELAEGGKYTREEFKSYAVGKVVGNPCHWYISLQTSIYGYSQRYSGSFTLEEAKTEFVYFYYPMYLKDYERSTDVDEMDEE